LRADRNIPRYRPCDGARGRQDVLRIKNSGMQPSLIGERSNCQNAVLVRHKVLS
jgi:hypothetical protein